MSRKWARWGWPSPRSLWLTLYRPGDWSAWCTCTHQPWYPQYSKECCAAGKQYCY